MCLDGQIHDFDFVSLVFELTGQVYRFKLTTLFSRDHSVDITEGCYSSQWEYACLNNSIMSSRSCVIVNGRTSMRSRFHMVV